MHKIFVCCAAFLSAAIFAAVPAEVKVSSFNPGKDDATAAFEAAIATGAKKVIVDDPGFPYIIRPVFLRSDLEIVFQNNVLVRAKKGEFRGRTDSLFKARDAKNLIIRGEGNATLEMNKSDYQNPKEYAWAEWRMCVSIAGCENVVIRDLTLKSSGGDGIYVGATTKLAGCRNVLIDNVICDNHHRQGISVISADGLVIRNSKFINTSGTPPACGVDFEPNHSYNFLTNILVENCDFSGNSSSGILFHLLTLKKDVTKPVSITVKNCTANNNGNKALTVNIGDVSGEIVVDNCSFSGNNASVGIKCMLGNLKLIVKNSVFKDKNGVISILADKPYDSGNIFFENVKLFTSSAAPVSFECMEGFGITNCDFNFVYGKDEKSMKKFDSAAFLKKNAPDPAKRKNIQTVAIQPGKLKAANSTAGKDGWNNLLIRGKFRFIQAVPAAGTYPIRFNFRKIGKFNLAGTIKVWTDADTLVETVNVANPTNNEYVYNLQANRAGVYIFECHFGSHGVRLHSDFPGLGLLADKPLPMIYGRKKMYFVVPAKANEVKIEVNGSGGEWVTASLVNAENQVMDKVIKSSAGKILYAKRTPTDKDEIWMVDLQGQEDHKVRIGAPSLPLFYAAPENILIGK